MIGGKVDLDLLSQILKNEQESWEGLRGRASSSNSNNGGVGEEELDLLKVEEGLFIVEGEIKPLGERDRKTGRKTRPAGGPAGRPGRAPDRPAHRPAQPVAGPVDRIGPPAGPFSEAFFARFVNSFFPNGSIFVGL